MKHTKYNKLILLAIVAGLFFTYGCGGSKSISSSLSTGTGSLEGVTITNEVSDPADMGIGDIITVQFSNTSSTSLDFSNVDESSEYFLAVASLDTGYGSQSVTLGSLAAYGKSSASEAAFEEEVWDSWTTEDAFQQRLMNLGHALAVDPEMEIAEKSGVNGGLKAASLDFSVAVGDTEEFRVLNSLSSSSSYTTVEARAKCVTDNLILYLDTEVEDTNPTDLEDSDIDALCASFDEQIDMERGWFGDESDVNDDGRVAALLTPQVNRLGAMGGGIITGFFLASDLYSRTGSNSISNEREIVYALVPDSRGDYGMVLPKSFTIDNLLTAVLPHELQHVISYNQHVFLGEGTPEENWLNEGMSHLTEDLVGYGQENYSRVGVYFRNTAYYQVAGYGSPSLGDRGAAYLFMRFLYEQHSNPAQFLADLYVNDKSGVANIEAAYDGASADFDQYGEFFMRWMAAVAMSNRGISQDSKYSYEARTFNSETERYQGMCLYCSAEDGRGTSLTGPAMYNYSGGSSFSVYPSSTRFYDISSPPSEISFAGVEPIEISRGYSIRSLSFFCNWPYASGS